MKRLTAFYVPFGCFIWLQMPMEISSATEVFQRQLTKALEALQVVKIIVDDSFLAGEAQDDKEPEQDHNQKRCAFLQRCRDKNIKWNA